MIQLKSSHICPGTASHLKNCPIKVPARKNLSKKTYRENCGNSGLKCSSTDFGGQSLQQLALTVAVSQLCIELLRRSFNTNPENVIVARRKFPANVHVLDVV
ncbi:hypothetical protein J437_LFUL013205 [Ladona fulva]|uniref:Uncharacterized protein n=1 Tax=Ladona fulva TaxID=123851 RepID=A0A8K0P5P6_LADFU|nr:hypothetical protein J437_LFUL013205 [Ladona fulva]